MEATQRLIPLARRSPTNSSRGAQSIYTARPRQCYNLINRVMRTSINSIEPSHPMRFQTWAPSVIRCNCEMIFTVVWETWRVLFTQKVDFIAMNPLKRDVYRVKFISSARRFHIFFVINKLFVAISRGNKSTRNVCYKYRIDARYLVSKDSHSASNLGASRDQTMPNWWKNQHLRKWRETYRLLSEAHIATFELHPLFDHKSRYEQEIYRKAKGRGRTEKKFVSRERSHGFVLTKFTRNGDEVLAGRRSLRLNHSDLSCDLLAILIIWWCSERLGD